MQIPRIIIAGTNSGCGKTTLATGIMAALAKRGYRVQPFKVGPDYIDPMFHTFITGNRSRNLDSWMLAGENVSYLFARNSAQTDISVIEGVMGLYDGFGGYSEGGSTAHVSKLIKAPVILVVNGEGMSLSIAALIKGYKDFDGEVDIKGVIINRIKSSSHYMLLKEIIEENTGLKAVGYLPPMEEYSLQSRHLGLVPSDEIKDLKEKIDLLAGQLEKTIELEALLEIARQAVELPPPVIPVQIEESCRECTVISGKPRIGVARDKAFNFYYQDNLDLLEMLGAELVYFSPLTDQRLPGGLDGLYIGGGYPEVFAEVLRENHSMRADIREKVSAGLPAYAECGGLMYLSESIEDREGNSFEMVGLIPGKSRMTEGLQRFGYVEVEAVCGNVLAKEGSRIRGHEFHYSVTDVDAVSCFKVIKKRKGNRETSWTCGYKQHNLLAGYPHLHFWGNIQFAENFVANCRQWAIDKRQGV